ncbi:hypothetical protein N4G58_03640 [Edwardsiella piscicida]|nr:hypothetical protein N4G58_03640 [Edwardsiella piscicida]
MKVRFLIYHYQAVMAAASMTNRTIETAVSRRQIFIKKCDSTTLARITIMTKPDWAAIAVAFQAGELSLRAIGAQHGVSEGAIRKMAKKHGWVRGEKTVRKKYAGTQKGTQKKQGKSAYR